MNRSRGLRNQMRRNKSLCSLFEGNISHHDEEIDGEEEVLDRAGHATLHLEVVFEKFTQIFKIERRNRYYDV